MTPPHRSPSVFSLSQLTLLTHFQNTTLVGRGSPAVASRHPPLSYPDIYHVTTSLMLTQHHALPITCLLSLLLATLSQAESIESCVAGPLITESPAQPLTAPLVFPSSVWCNCHCYTTSAVSLSEALMSPLPSTTSLPNRVSDSLTQPGTIH